MSTLWRNRKESEILSFSIRLEAGGHVMAGSTKWATGVRCFSVQNIVMSADMTQGVRYFLVHTG